MTTAYYLITITPTNGKTVSAVRVLPEEPIDKLWNQYEMKANGVYRDLRYFNIVLLSRHSQEVQDFLSRQQGGPGQPVIPMGKDRPNKQGPGKWTLGDRMNNP